MRYVTKVELLEVLKGIGNAAIVGCTLETSTEPTMVGKDKPKDVRKVMRMKITLNSIYENKVNRQLDREGKETEFETAGDPAWKKRISRLLSYHAKDETKIYVDYMPEKVESVGYLKNDIPIVKDDLKQWLKEKPEAEGERQGTDKPVVFRHVSLDNVVSLAIRGELLVVKN